MITDRIFYNVYYTLYTCKYFLHIHTYLNITNDKVSRGNSLIFCQLSHC